MRISDWSSDVCSSDLIVERLLFAVEDVDVARRYLHRAVAAVPVGDRVGGDTVGDRRVADFQVHRYHRLSNFRRSRIARMFMQIRTASSTMIAADVRSTKARSGLSAHRQICTRRTVTGSNSSAEALGVGTDWGHTG